MRATLFTHARLLDPVDGFLSADALFIDQGKICQIGTSAELSHAFKSSNTEVINCRSLLLAPCIIDSYSQIGHLALKQSRSFETELDAFAAGGIATTICAPDTQPVLDETGLVEILIKRATQHAKTRVLPLGACSQGLKGERLAEMLTLVEAGCVGLSQANYALPNHLFLLRAMQYAATFDLLLVLQPNDFYLSQWHAVTQNAHSTDLGLPTASACSEVITVFTLLTLAAQCGVRLHLSRISQAQSVTLIEQAKQRGERVSCDVSIQHLFFTTEDIAYFDTRAKLFPPLRDAHDREALLTGLNNGVIDAVCSDHCLVTAAQKELPFGEAALGTGNAELLLSACLSMTHAATPIECVWQWLTTNPARIYCIDPPRLKIGACADILLCDEQAHWQVTTTPIHTASETTLFTHSTLKGQVKACWLRGLLAYQQTAYESEHQSK